MFLFCFFFSPEWPSAKTLTIRVCSCSRFLPVQRKFFHATFTCSADKLWGFVKKKQKKTTKTWLDLCLKCCRCLTFHSSVKWAVLLAGSNLQLHLRPRPPLLATHCVCDWLLIVLFYLFMWRWQLPSYPNDSGHNAANLLPWSHVYSHAATSAGSNWAHFYGIIYNRVERILQLCFGQGIFPFSFYFSREEHEAVC